MDGENNPERIRCEKRKEERKEKRKRQTTKG